MPSRKLIGLTGPSVFSDYCMSMIEEFFDANYVLLYHNNEDNLRYWLEHLDGIIFAGGADIHPSVYGQAVWLHHNLSKFDLPRDKRELFLVNQCIEKRKPFLGICRGHQVIGIQQGLRLLIDISNSMVSHSPTKHGISLDEYEPAHYVELVKEAYFYDYYCPSKIKEREFIKDFAYSDERHKIWVNSFHHQAIHYTKSNDRNVTVIGSAPIDNCGSYKNIIELMEGPSDDPFWVSCQWHPEWDWKCNTVSTSVLERFKCFLERK